jgi:MoxR-like ATPase
MPSEKKPHFPPDFYIKKATENMDPESREFFETNLEKLFTLKAAREETLAIYDIFRSLNLIQSEKPISYKDFVNLMQNAKQMETAFASNLAAAETPEQAEQIRQNLREFLFYHKQRLIPALKTINHINPDEEAREKFDLFLKKIVKPEIEDEMMTLLAHEKAFKTKKTAIGDSTGAENDFLASIEETARKIKADETEDGEPKEKSKRAQEINKRSLDFNFAEYRKKTGHDFNSAEFVATYLLNLKRLKAMKRSLEQGTVVETAYVKEIIQKIEEAKQTKTPILLMGETGTGKTEIATHAARKLTKKEPIIIAAHELISTGELIGGERTETPKIEDLYERFNFSLPEGEHDEFKLKVDLQDQLTKKIKKNPSIKNPAVEAKNIIDSYLKTPFVIKEVAKGVKKAVQDKCPVIIDEAPNLHPNTLMAINIVMNGHKKDLPDDFILIMTGNPNQGRYTDDDTIIRHTFDTATLDRITVEEVDYPSQSTHTLELEQNLTQLNFRKLADKLKTLNESDVKKLLEDSIHRAEIDHLFQILLVPVLNKRLGLYLRENPEEPYSTVEDIYRLAVGSRLVMDILEKNKKRVKDLNYDELTNLIGDTSSDKIIETLHKSTVSIRGALNRVVKLYFENNQRDDIEYRLWQYLQKFRSSPIEMAIIYVTYKKAGFFNPDQGWPDIQELTKEKTQAEALQAVKQTFSTFNPGEKITKYHQIQSTDGETLVEVQGKTLHYVPSLETLAATHGLLPPLDLTEPEKVYQETREKEILGELLELNKKLTETYNMFLSLIKVNIPDQENSDRIKLNSRTQEINNSISFDNNRPVSEIKSNLETVTAIFNQAIEEIQDTSKEITERIQKINKIFDDFIQR